MTAIFEALLLLSGRCFYLSVPVDLCGFQSKMAEKQLCFESL